MSASILSILGCILPGLINLTISTLYGWSLTQPFSNTSGSPFPLFLLLGVRDVGLRTEVNEATIWVLAVVFVTDLPVPIDISSLSSLHFYFILAFTDYFHVILYISYQFELQQSFFSPLCTVAHPPDIFMLSFWRVYLLPSLCLFCL